MERADSRRAGMKRAGAWRSVLERAQSSRLALACAAGVGLVATAARIPGAVRDAFWEDEVASAHVLIQSTPWGMLHQVARTEATPPLWYALGWLANQLGVSPVAYRGLSVLAGALLAGGTVLVARRVLPLWAGVLAGLLAALGWQFVMHGRELRAYELFALASVLFAGVLLRQRAAGGSGRWRRWGLPAVVAFGSLTNYFFLLSVIGALLWLWREPELRSSRRRLARQIGIGLIPLAVWSPVAVHQYLGQHFSWIGPFRLGGLLDSYWELFLRSVPGGTPGLLASLLVLGAVLMGSGVLAGRSAEGRLLALLAVVPVALCGLAWLAGAHVFDPRNLIGAGPFAAMALAALAAALPRPAGCAAAAGAAGALAAAAAHAESTPPTPYDAVSRILVGQGWQPRDPILIFGTPGDFFAFRSPLEWYLPGRPTLTLGEPAGDRTCPAVFAVAQSPAVRSMISDSRLLGARARAGAVLVGRLKQSRVPTHGLWRSGHILAGRKVSSPCVRLVPEAGIISALEH